MTADALVLLREIRDEQRRLAGELAAIREAFEHRHSARPADAAAVGLLRAIHATTGKLDFTGADLAEHAALPDATTLRAAIVAAVGSLQPRRIGKALRALEGRDIGGLTVLRHGAGRDGVLWRVCEFASLKLAFTVAPGRT